MPTTAASAAVAEGGAPPITPISATAPAGRGRWKRVNISNDFLIVTGGYITRHELVPCIRHQTGTTTHDFVELDKNAQWFLKGVGGPKCNKGDLKPVLVLDEIRSKLRLATPQSRSDAPAPASAIPNAASSAVAGDDADDTDDDPMCTLDDIASPPVATPKKTYMPKRIPARATVQTVTMPKRPPCSARAAVAGTVTIRLYMPLGDKKKKMYMQTDSLDWLLSYAADELHFQGVERRGPEPHEDTPPTNTAVAGVNLRWDFTTKAWHATFVSGAFAGKTVRVDATHLDDDRWNKLRSMGHVGQRRGGARGLAYKDAAKTFIDLWCNAIDDNAGDDFEREWCLRACDAAVAETPVKRRRDCADEIGNAAVADDPAAGLKPKYMRKGAFIEE